MKKTILLLTLWLIAFPAFAWTDGELLVWMDADRTRALQPILKKFEDRYAIKVHLESPQNITDSFPTAAQSGKGPDIVIWAHDVVGEWADAGLISPVEVHQETREKYFPQAWEAVTHNNRVWGFPIGMETVTLIYNKRLLPGEPPKSLSQLTALSEKIKQEHPGVASILWDYKSAYYSWGILASAGAYIWARDKGGYDLRNVGVANSGAAEAVSEILELVRAGVLPKSVSYSVAEDLMSQGKLAMMISGPWAWANLMKRGIEFGVAPVPGCDDKPSRPFVGVSAGYINRASANQDIATEFIEGYLISEEGLNAMNDAKPIGIPALKSLAEKLDREDPLLREMKMCVEQGEVMPNIPEMGRFWTAVSSALQLAANGQAPVQSALDEAAENMRKH
ncbi:MAG: maltose/maltodextrin ABC transporter substrate-binding protein MalE [Verrucomicrobia bacterium]|nr:maltose/maltodextrin ABC transporter substrate-binding protein MalE [Verrucomicrobiota bacterium]MBV9644613.1 maltose/maltodextrin ABC transporter substrate-binding protein MalE [Verrucomicrobiota bacterium]